MKKIIRILLRIIVTPALFIHELCHVLASLIVGLSPKNFGWSFFILRGPINAMVYFDETAASKIEGSFRRFIIDIAPLFAFAYIGYMATNIEFFKYFLMYEFLVLPFSFMSAIDFNSALKYLGVKKEVKFFYNTWLIKFDNWLYFEGMTEEEYLEKKLMDGIE